MVVPITDWKPHYASFPWFVEIASDPNKALAKHAGADAFQAKSVSLRRFRHRLGVVSDAQIDAVASAVALCVGAT